MTIADFERMVDMALADGVLTPEEQQVLINRAAELQLTPAELQMIIDARVHEMNSRKEQAAAASTPEAPAPTASSDKNGGIKKCPACGAHISGFSTNCPECGHEFSGVQAVGSASRLFDMLQECSRRASKEMSEFETRKNSRLEELNNRHAEATRMLTQKQNEGGAMAKLISSASAKKQERDDLAETQATERRALVNELEKSRRSIESKLLEEKRQIIKNYPVPNAKEDLMELLTMASSNAYDNDGVIGPEEEVWIQKTDQIYSKIKSLAKNDKPFLEEATNIIMSLMTRLPKGYKQFTSLPEEYKTRMAEQIKASRNIKNEAKKQALIDSFMRYKIVLGISLALLLVGAIWDLADTDLGVGTLLWIAGAIMTFIFTKKAIKAYQEEQKTINAY